MKRRESKSVVQEPNVRTLDPQSMREWCKSEVQETNIEREPDWHKENTIWPDRHLYCMWGRQGAAEAEKVKW